MKVYIVRSVPLEEEVVSILNIYGYVITERIEDADFVLALGGDGTVISAAYQALRHDKQVLGFNKGTLGFLTADEKNFERLIQNFSRGKYEQEKRDVLVINKGEKDERFVFNEIAIITAVPGRLVTVPLNASDGWIADYKGDGLIISTPTGSTAWNLSAGGPILHHRAKGIVITPITPFSLSARPIVIGDDIWLTTEIDETRKVIIDGEERPFKEMVIRKSRHTFKLLRPYRYFYKSIREKLNWGFQIKEKKNADI